MWYMHGFGGGWMIAGSIIMFVFWAGIIGLIAWGISRLFRHRITTGRQDPLDIARERYAKGEITREQFEEIKKNL
jgi:putative membrane protein